MCYAPREAHTYNGGWGRLWLSPGPRGPGTVKYQAIMWLVPLTRVWRNPGSCSPSQWTGLNKIKANSPRAHPHQVVSPSLPQKKFRDSAPSGKKYLRWEKVTNSPSPYPRLLMDLPIVSETCFAFLYRLFTPHLISFKLPSHLSGEGWHVNNLSSIFGSSVSSVPRNEWR